MTLQINISVPGNQATEARVTTGTDDHASAVILAPGDSMLVHVHSSNDVRIVEVPQGSKQNLLDAREKNDLAAIREATRAAYDDRTRDQDKIAVRGSAAHASSLRDEAEAAQRRKMGQDAIAGMSTRNHPGQPCAAACDSHILRGLPTGDIRHGDLHSGLRDAVHESMAQAEREEARQGGWILGELHAMATPPVSAEAHRQALEHAALPALADAVAKLSGPLVVSGSANAKQLGQDMRAAIDALLGVTAPAGAKVINGDLQVNGTISIVGGDLKISAPQKNDLLQNG